MGSAGGTPFSGLAAADIVRRCLTGDQPEVAGWEYAAGVGVCAALVGVATRVRMPWLANPVLLWLGAVSYPLYLVHATMGYIVIRRLSGIGVEANLAVGGAIVFMLALASAITYGVERPAGRAIRGWWKRRALGRTTDGERVGE